MQHTESINRDILNMRVDVTNYPDASSRIIHWADEGKSGYVCAANVHMVMETHDDPSFNHIVNNADLVTPDGMPLVWALRMMGVEHATRVYGPDLTLHVCEAAAKNNISIGLYGGTEESLVDFERFLRERYPGIRIACKIAPPFRPLTPEEDAHYTEMINASGVQVLFVGIGCPKQEKWMAEHKSTIHAMMLGVGAAFDFHTGRVKQAPAWMQKMGMEWFFRLMMEPQRLWKRYFKHNPRFAFLLAMQLVKMRFQKN